MHSAFSEHDCIDINLLLDKSVATVSYLLCILTSKRVLCMPLAGRNKLPDAKTTFSVTHRTK